MECPVGVDLVLYWIEKMALPKLNACLHIDLRLYSHFATFVLVDMKYFPILCQILHVLFKMQLNDTARSVLRPDTR